MQQINASTCSMNQILILILNIIYNSKTIEFNTPIVSIISYYSYAIILKGCESNMLLQIGSYKKLPDALTIELKSRKYRLVKINKDRKGSAQFFAYQNKGQREYLNSRRLRNLRGENEFNAFKIGFYLSHLKKWKLTAKLTLNVEIKILLSKKG